MRAEELLVHSYASLLEVTIRLTREHNYKDLLMKDHPDIIELLDDVTKLHLCRGYYHINGSGVYDCYHQEEECPLFRSSEKTCMLDSFGDLSKFQNVCGLLLYFMIEVRDKFQRYFPSKNVMFDVMTEMRQFLYLPPTETKSAVYNTMMFNIYRLLREKDVYSWFENHNSEESSKESGIKVKVKLIPADKILPPAAEKPLAEESGIFSSRIARDSDIVTRLEIAENPSTPAEVLFQLAKDESWTVRCNVAQNPNTSIGVLLQMIEDNIEGVSQAAKKNINRRKDTGEVILEGPALPSNRFVDWREELKKYEEKCKEFGRQHSRRSERIVGDEQAFYKEVEKIKEVEKMLSELDTLAKIEKAAIDLDD